MYCNLTMFTCYPNLGALEQPVTDPNSGVPVAGAATGQAL